MSFRFVKKGQLVVNENQFEEMKFKAFVEVPSLEEKIKSKQETLDLVRTANVKLNDKVTKLEQLVRHYKKTIDKLKKENYLNKKKQ